MNREIELKQLKKEITKLKKQVALLKGEDDPPIPTYQYSKIRDAELKKLFKIQQKLDDQAFDEWFNNPIEIDDSVKIFLTDLIAKHKFLVEGLIESQKPYFFIQAFIKT